MSMRIEMRIAKANAAPICAVNVAVWVMNPGPIAEVAMRKIAPTMALRLIFSCRRPSGLSWSGGGETGVCDMGSPMRCRGVFG